MEKHKNYRSHQIDVVCENYDLRVIDVSSRIKILAPVRKPTREKLSNDRDRNQMYFVTIRTRATPHDINIIYRGRYIHADKTKRRVFKRAKLAPAILFGRFTISEPTVTIPKH